MINPLRYLRHKVFGINNLSGGKVLNPTVIWFLIGMILANLANNMYRMYLPIYILNELGASIEQVGLVFTVSALMPLTFQVLGGWVSDMVGRLVAIAVGSMGGIVGYFMIITAKTWQFMMLAIAVEYFSNVMVSPSFGPFIADQSEPHVRGKLYGISTALFAIVTVVGPPLGGLIANYYSIKTLLWIGAIPYVMSFILRLSMGIWELRQQKARSKLKISTLTSGLKNLFGIAKLEKTVIWLIITGGIIDIVSKNIPREVMPLFMEEIAGLNPQQIGVVSAMFGIATMLFAVVAGSLSDRIGEKWIISTGFIFVAAGLIIFTVVPAVPLFILAWFIYGMGNAMLGPTVSSLVSKIVPKNQYGLAFGLFRTMTGIIALPSSWLAAKLWVEFTPQTPLFIAIVIVFIFSFISWKKLELNTDLNNQEIV